MSATDAEHTHLMQAIDLAAASVTGGGGPFGAVVVTADQHVFTGTNLVTATYDPTAHAEVTAIRTACAELGTFDLTAAVLYASCEPCPMCLAAALWARVGKVIYAANRDDAARAGFDDAAFYEYFESPRRRTVMQLEQVSTGRDCEPFDQWRADGSRIPY